MCGRVAGAVALAAVGLTATGQVAWGGDLLKLFTGADYELESGLSYFPHNYHPDDNREVDDNAVEWYGRASAKAQANATESVVIGYNAYATYSTIKGEYRPGLSYPGETKSTPARIDFNTLFARWEGEAAEVTVGKQKIQVGVAELYSPADRFGRMDLTDPSIIRTLGVWQVGVKKFIGDDSLAFYFIPFEQHDYVPQVPSRWVGEGSDGSFYRLMVQTGATIEERWHESKTERFGYLLHYKGVGPGFDYFAALHHGPSNYAVLREKQLRLVGSSYWKEFPVANTVAIGAAKTIGSWKLFDEALYQDTLHGKDQDFVKNAVGFSYKDTDLAEILGFEEIEPVFEFATDGATREVYHGQYVTNSEGARRFESSLLGRIRVRQDNEWSYFVDGTYSFTDEDYSIGLGIEYKPDDNTTISATARKFEGIKDGQLGIYRLNNYVGLRVIRKF